MSYWDKIKNAIGLNEKKDLTEKNKEIVFTPEELREMRSPDTVVGRLLNPVYKSEEFPKGGARELYEQVELPKDADYADYFDINKKRDDAISGKIADAYIKDAEKRGIVHPDEDRATKNYKIIEDFKKRKGLSNVSIVQEPHSFRHGFVTDSTEPGRYQPDADRIVMYPHSKTPFDLGKPTKDKMYDYFPSEKQQKFNADKHLTDTIHEIMHAEDFETDREQAEKGYPSHFKNAGLGTWFAETPEYKGRMYEIEQAALQRLANMGKEKK